jgi:hypothetical protein
MVKIHAAIFPAILIGIALLILSISLLSPSENVSAGTTSLIGSTGNAASSPGHPVFVGQLPSTSEQSDVEVTVVDQVNASNSSLDDTNDLDSCSLSQAYPESIQKWCNLITQVAADFELDANFVAAVMLQESGGNADAYSKSGAVGLMQVMPKDGIAAKFICVNGPCFANRPSSEELFDPTFNIQYGVRMLAGLLNRYGTLRDALKAYGPMDIGFNYADKVLAIYENYQ